MFVDDFRTWQGVVPGRAVSTLRSVETSFSLGIRSLSKNKKDETPPRANAKRKSERAPGFRTTAVASAARYRFCFRIVRKNAQTLRLCVLRRCRPTAAVLQKTDDASARTITKNNKTHISLLTSSIGCGGISGALFLSAKNKRQSPNEQINLSFRERARRERDFRWNILAPPGRCVMRFLPRKIERRKIRNGFENRPRSTSRPGVYRAT